MSTPGYRSVAKTKESGAPKQVIPPGVWTLIDFGLLDRPEKVNIFNAQLYFEKVSLTVHRMSIRLARGSGNDTGQDDFLVQGPTWARSYLDIDFVQYDDETPSPSDVKRGIEVWSAKGCDVWTRIDKSVRPITTEGDIA